MNEFEDYCNQAECSIKNSNNRTTRDVAMCQIVTGVAYSILALAKAVMNRSADEKLIQENKKLRKIANKALDDKNKFLDEKIKEQNKCKIKRTR